jgi:hypothetical protein
LKKWVVRPVGLKRQVFRSVRNSLQVRQFLGIFFLRDPNCNYSGLRILAWPVVEDLEGKWGG